MLSPWTLGTASLSVLAVLYYISWTYAAKWLCRILLQGKVVFSTSTKALAHNGEQNGIVKEIAENSVNHRVRSLKNHSTSDSGAAQRRVCAPYVVTRGVLAEISQLMVGQVVSVSAVLAGAIVMYQTQDDVLHSKSVFLVPYVHTVVGYFALDSVAMFWSFRQVSDQKRETGSTSQLGRFLRKKWSFLLHHMLVLTVAYPLIVNYPLRRGMGDFFVGMLIIEDLSTPFLSAAKILRLLGLKSTPLYRINGLILLTSFLLVRVLYVPLAVLIYARQYHNWSIWSALNSMYSVCHFFNAVQFFLQTYWYLAIVSIALGTVRRTKSAALLAQSSVERTGSDVKQD